MPTCTYMALDVFHQTSGRYIGPLPLLTRRLSSYPSCPSTDSSPGTTQIKSQKTATKLHDSTQYPMRTMAPLLLFLYPVARSSSICVHVLKNQEKYPQVSSDRALFSIDGWRLLAGHYKHSLTPTTTPPRCGQSDISLTYIVSLWLIESAISTNQRLKM